MIVEKKVFSILPKHVFKIRPEYLFQIYFIKKKKT